MIDHPIILLVQKIESYYTKEIHKHLSASKKQRTEKLYKLIVGAKNKDQLDKELLFKKMYGKSYSEKNDYLWRNEIRVLKEELESFLITTEHQYHSKNNEAYNSWLLTQAFDRLKYQDGIDEKYDALVEKKDDFACYNYVLDAQLIKVLNLQHTVVNMTKRMEKFPAMIEESMRILNDLIAMYTARINVSIAQYNWMCEEHQNDNTMPHITTEFKCELPKNNISEFYNNYALSLKPNFKVQIACLEQALKDIEPIIKNNTLYEENSIIIYTGLGREFSANGHFLKAHEYLSFIKNDIDKKYHQYRTIFYVNYITNLVKSKMYKEALYTLENEFSTDNLLFKNMLLQNRLLCYVYMRDTKNLSNYISYDLDAAPFPQNYMLKVIKSTYFYLTKEYDTALSIINSLLHAKYASENMQYYQPISTLYKRLYTTSQKNAVQKKWNDKDIEPLKKMIVDFEDTATNEMKLVSIYLWIKQEIETNLV